MHNIFFFFFLNVRTYVSSWTRLCDVVHGMHKISETTKNKEDEVIEAVPQNAKLPKSKYRQKYRWHGGLNSLLKCYNHTVRKLLAWKFLFPPPILNCIVAHPHKYIYTHTPHFTLLSSPSVQVTKCILQSALNIHHDGKWIKYFYVLSAYIALKIQKFISMYIFYKIAYIQYNCTIQTYIHVHI